MEQHTKIPKHIIAAFQNTYFGTFPGIRMYQEWVRDTLASEGTLVTLTGRRRRFFGRRTEADTQREAIAFIPQGSVADILNSGLLSVWRSGICQLLMQVHDAILVQYPEGREDLIVPAVQDLLRVPLPLEHGRTLTIPSDAKTGWNWGAFSPENPDGMKKYKGHDKRTRTSTPKTGLLDRRLG
jgi:DNA polymerase I-like protein with 3'-5' exonuclease and polymerase domains